mgnify:FL=1
MINFFSLKNIFIFFLTSLNFTLFSQTLLISDLEKINVNQEGSYRPRICLVNEGPLILFSENSEENKIFINKKQGEFWSGEQQINPDGIDIQMSASTGPSLASNGQIVYVAYIVESNPRKIAFHKSDDGGDTFSSLITALDLNEDYALGLDMILLPDGNPVIAFIHYDSNWTNVKQALIRSYDQGISFTEIITIDDSPCECCKPSLVSGENYYGVSFRDNESNIRVFKTRISSNADANFSQTVLTDPTEWESVSCPASPSDGFLINDTLYNSWMSGSDGLPRVYLSKTKILEDNILEWSEVDFSASTSFQNYPRIDGNSIFQMVVWEEFHENYIDIFGKIIHDDSGESSISLTQGDSISNMESVDIVFDSQSNLFHLVYRNINQSAVMYRSIEPIIRDLSLPTSSNFKIYPNPSNHELFISENLNNLNYKIYNSLGTVVKTGFTSNNITIEILPKGSYILELIDSTQNKRFWFIKN